GLAGPTHGGAAAGRGRPADWRRATDGGRADCACAGRAAGRGAAAGGGAAAEQHLPEQKLLEDDQRPDRVDRGQRLGRLSQLAAEQTAALAVAQMAANQGGAAAQALGGLAELDADFLAGEQPCLGGLGQRYTRAHE